LPDVAGVPSSPTFALIESYLSTAAKWGISKLDALRDLFNGNAWMPPGLEPAG
jgi:transposase